jgi:hypothetical protein
MHKTLLDGAMEQQAVAGEELTGYNQDIHGIYDV